MTTDRVRGVAATIVERSLDLDGGENVVVTSGPVAEPLVEALYGRLGEAGATPMWITRSDRAVGAYLRRLDPADVTPSEHSAAALEAADVQISIRGTRNDYEHSDVPEETLRAVQAADPRRRDGASGQSVLVQYPGPGDAQRAAMSTAAYEELVYSAIDRDWEAQERRQQRVAEALESGERLRIRSGDGTDLRMSVDGMRAVNECGEVNLPGGEVYTAPVVDSLEGSVTFDVPRLIRGTELRRVEFTFEGGEIVDYGAERGEQFLEGLLHVDDGSGRIGEVGFGMNAAVDRCTREILVDEKMYGTVHLAIGSGYDACVPDEAERNASGIHQDFLVDTREDSRVEVDGKPILVDGEFVV